MIATLRAFRLNFTFVFVLYVALTVLATSQAVFRGKVTNEVNGREYTRYNNYVIFKQSFFHLLGNQDLYREYPEEQWDLYKYSPTFALLFAPLALLPDFPGLLIWNLLNALVVFFAIRYLPGLSDKVKILALLTLAVELLTSMQNEQSNGLMAGLMIGAFALLERKKFFWATLCLVLSVYIKIFGLVAFALFLFYPGKLRLAAYTVFWTGVLLVLPLGIISPEQLIFQYQSWRGMLAQDHVISDGLSVMGWLKTWFNLEPNKTVVLAFGAGLFLVPLLRFRQYGDYLFRLLVLASLLIWVVIFNHRAESPTFIIAMAGVALWYLPQVRNPLNLTLFVLAIVFTSLSPTDLFPKFIREDFFKPYVIKGVPCILVWLKITYELIFIKYAPDPKEVTFVG